MREWWAGQLDYIYFLYGLAFLLLALVCWRPRRGQAAERSAWEWLAAFGLLHGLLEWLDLALLGQPPSPRAFLLRTVYLALTFVPLLACGLGQLTRRRGPAATLAAIAVLGLLGVVAGRGGTAELAAAWRLTLGLPGGLLAGLALLRAAAATERCCQRRGLRLTGLALIGYGLATGLVPAPAGSGPASMVNTVTFFETFGTPIQAWRALCACLMALGMYPQCPVFAAPLVARSLAGRLALPLTLAAVVALGWLATEWRGRVAARESLTELQHHATALARAINRERVRVLAFGPADDASAAYRRLCSQMAGYARFAQLGAVRSAAHLAGRLVHGPESVAPDSAEAGRPGATWRWPSAAVIEEALRTAEPGTRSPATTPSSVATAVAPVVDRGSEVTLAVVVEQPSAWWTARVAAARRAAIGSCLLLVALLLAGLCAVQRRGAVPVEAQGWWLRHAETGLTLLLGATVSGLVAAAVMELEHGARRSQFTQLAESKSLLVGEAFREIRGNLEGMARLLSGPGDLGIRRFDLVTDPRGRSSVVERWELVAVVPDAERVAFEQAMRQRGYTGFSIHEPSATGQLVPAARDRLHYPLLRRSAVDALGSQAGLDLGRDPRLAELLAEATLSGLVCARAAVPLVGPVGAGRRMVMAQPVYAHGSARPTSFVLAWLQLEPSLTQILASGRRSAPMVLLDAFDLDRTRPPAWLAGHPYAPEGPPWAYQPAGPAGYQTAYPLFICGRSWAIVVRPGPALIASWTVYGGMTALAMGLLLTVVVTALVGSLRHRHVLLEEQVFDRTRALRLTQFACDHGADCALRIHPDGSLAYANEAACHTFGYPSDELLAMSIDDLHPDFGLARWSAHWQELRTQGGLTFQTTFRHRDGHDIPVEVRANYVCFDGEEFNWAFVRDVTAVKEAAEERAKLESQLRQAQKMEAVGQLAGGVAHDFNNLLQVISGYTAMALDALGAGDPARTSLEEVCTASQRAAKLVSQLLAFGRRQLLRPATLDLNEVVAGLLKMLSRVIGEHIRITFTPLPFAATVLADQGMVEQVLMNLCVNARDAMPDGGTLTITTHAVVFDEHYCVDHDWAKPGRHIVLSVADTGCGMDAATAERVFEPFFTTKAVGRGTGLGLATVYGIVRQHGGSIQVYSEVRQGTVFRVYLPMVELAPAATAAVLPVAPQHGSETVLLAEDDEMVHRLACRILETAGYTVLLARDGMEAMSLFDEHVDDIAVLLLDVVMPAANGPDVLRHARSRRPDIKALFASGYSDTHLDNTGDVPVIGKPYDRNELLRVLRDVLDAPAAATVT